jgi:mycothiol synthase
LLALRAGSGLHNVSRSWTIRVAQPPEWRQALALALAHVPDADRETRVANAIILLNTGELDPDGVLVAVADHRLVGAQVSVRLRGASGLVWAPSVTEAPDGAAIADALLQAALAWLRGKGARFVQALLDPDAGATSEPLVGAGFHHVTDLFYLRRGLDEITPLAPSAGLHIDTYSDANAALFEATLLRTYEGSRDCPELDGLRSGAEILDGHRAQGVWRPETWWLAFQDGQPAGVCLLTELEDGAGWDLSYLGVVPQFRGRGLGQTLTLHALHAARALGASEIMVAVDARNTPALALYHAAGFRRTGVKAVYLRWPARS